MSGHYYFIDTVNYHLQATAAPTLMMPGDSAQEIVGGLETATQLLKYSRVLAVKSSNKMYVVPLHSFQSVLNVGRYLLFYTFPKLFI